MMKKILIILLTISVTFAAVKLMLNKYEDKVRECDRLTNNQTTLLDSVKHYRSQLGYSVAQSKELRLKLDEFKRYNANDNKLVQELAKGREMKSFTSVNSITSDTIHGTLSVGVIRRDTITDTVKCIDIDTKWYSLHGCINGDTFDGIHQSRDSIKVIESVSYKRFLGFLWKTNKVKDRKIDVVSLNPHTTIIGISYITVER